MRICVVILVIRVGANVFICVVWTIVYRYMEHGNAVRGASVEPQRLIKKQTQQTFNKITSSDMFITVSIHTNSERGESNAVTTRDADIVTIDKETNPVLLISLCNVVEELFASAKYHVPDYDSIKHITITTEKDPCGNELNSVYNASKNSEGIILTTDDDTRIQTTYTDVISMQTTTHLNVNVNESKSNETLLRECSFYNDGSPEEIHCLYAIIMGMTALPVENTQEALVTGDSDQLTECLEETKHEKRLHWVLHTLKHTDMSREKIVEITRMSRSYIDFWFSILEEAHIITTSNSDSYTFNTHFTEWWESNNVNTLTDAIYKYVIETDATPNTEQLFKKLTPTNTRVNY